MYLSSLLEVEMTSFQRIEEYIRTIPREAPPAPEPHRHGTSAFRPTEDVGWPWEGRLSVRQLTAGYTLDGEPVLRDVDLDVWPGKRVAIVGRTGSGKSSLVAAILRLIPKLGGEVAIDGADLETVEPEALRRSAVSFIPQNPTLFEGTLRFNLDFGAADTKNETEIDK